MTAPDPLVALLEDYVLGALDAENVRAVEEWLARDPAAAAEAAALQEAFSLVGLDAEPVAPPPALRDRLFASVAADGPLARFAAALGRLIDVSTDRARALLRWVEDETRWEALAPGCQAIHLPGGVATVGADVGFVRVGPGVAFPYHRHIGEEVVLVLAGGYRDSDGTVRRAGDLVPAPDDSAHGFVALDDQPLIYAVVTYGVDFSAEAPADS